MRMIAILILGVINLSCKKAPDDIRVTAIGTLRAIMHEGDMDAKLDLDTLSKEDLYGLGAVELLSGELLVLNGKTYQSTVSNDSILMLTESGMKASLFVYSYVQEWDTISVNGFRDVSELVAEKSKEGKLSEPFPFQLIGVPDSLAFHVINFDTVNGNIEEHKDGAYVGYLSNQALVILGFYSTKAQGIYTHHDSYVHLHFINDDQTLSGHVDYVSGGNRSFKLLMPKR